MFRLFFDTDFYFISFPANRQVSAARYNSPNRLFPAYFPRNAFFSAGADYPSGTIIYLCAFSVKRYSRFFLSLTELVKKGELTVEQGKVLNEELKHNIKDAICENVTLHIVTPEEDRGEADGDETDDTAALLGWAFVWKDQKNNAPGFFPRGIQTPMPFCPAWASL